MNCIRDRKLLALFAGGDLKEPLADRVSLHLQQCETCRRFYEGLMGNRTLLRSLRQETIPAASLTQMRSGLASRLHESRPVPGWRIRLERLLLFELRRPRYALAGIALMVIVSATLFAQFRFVAADGPLMAATAAVFEAGNTLQRPAGYRNWVRLGSSDTFEHGDERGLLQNAYIDPRAYQEFARTGAFPEGTVMVLELERSAPPSTSPRGQPGTGNNPAGLMASVKDRRFGDGWGYFRFSNGPEGVSERAQALPDTAGCVVCHGDRAATDHVFTQFYPVLRSAAGVL